MGASVRPKKEDFLRSHRGIGGTGTSFKRWFGPSFKQILLQAGVGREDQKGFKTAPEKPAIMPPAREGGDLEQGRAPLRRGGLPGGLPQSGRPRRDQAAHGPHDR